MNKKIIYILIVVPIIASLLTALFLGRYYEDKLDHYCKSEKKQAQTEKELLIQKLQQTYENTIKKYMQKRISEIEQEKKEILKKKLQFAYTIVENLKKKYTNKKRLKEAIILSLSATDIFISDYNANVILLGNQNIGENPLIKYVDKNGRSIVLEEIQKVRRHGEGFLKTTNSINSKQEIVFVKNLDLFNWFIGSVENIEMKEEVVQEYKVLLQNLKLITTNET
jgi:hypothetical protein